MDNRELFKGTAHYYARYRPGYPKEFFDFLRKEFNLDGTGSLLDVGCGTGQISIPLARDFEKVVGLDSEQEMLDEAAIEAERVGAKNIKWVLGKAENTTDTLWTFRLTTMGAAFHWMKQAKVLRKIYEHTENGGGVVIVTESAHVWKRDKTDDNEKERWKKIYKDLVRKYLGEERRAGNSLYRPPSENFDDALDDSPFGGHTEWTHLFSRTRTLEAIIGFLYSTSFASRRLLGAQVGAFEAELREKLLKLEPRGIFTEQVQLEALIGRK